MHVSRGYWYTRERKRRIPEACNRPEDSDRLALRQKGDG